MKTISDVTRRNILDELRLTNVDWAGRLSEPEFLARLYNLQELPSFDGRFANAFGDIRQHRVNNFDWDRDWVFTDSRFNLLHAGDEEFLRFLCEMVHPVVRPDSDGAKKIVILLNSHLQQDGWQIQESARISGHPLYSASRGLPIQPPSIADAQKIVDAIGTRYIADQLTRMQTALATSDSDLAIGTAKEFIETICKTILAKRGAPIEPDASLGKLVRTTIKAVCELPEASTSDGEIAPLRGLLSHLGGLTDRIGDLRNQHGTGHGQIASSTPLELRYARLAVNAATALSVFLFESELE